MATTTTLPTEIITEILIRLPIKSLLRFLSVSKSWFSLIKNPNFINLHLNQTLISNSDKYLILNRQNSIYISEFNIRNPLSFSELHYPPRPTGGQVIGSCNGVLCISDFSMTYVALLNPVTKEYRVIHPTRIRDFETECLVPVYYGFGYDSVTHDYKVFYYFRKFKKSEIDFNEVYIEVFSFKSNSWKSVENVCEFGSFFNSYGFYFNEAMYYVAYKRCESNLRRKFIVKFDFRTDSLLPMECPNSDDKFNESLLYSFSELDGCLCLLVSYFPEDSDVGSMIRLIPLVRADLWMMKGCDEGWVRLFSIGDPRNIGIEWEISAVGFKDGNGSRILLEVDGCKIGWYDVDNGSFETIVTCGLPESWYNSGMYYLSGSLVALQSQGRTFMTKKEEEEGEVAEV